MAKPFRLDEKVVARLSPVERLGAMLFLSITAPDDDAHRRASQSAWLMVSYFDMETNEVRESKAICRQLHQQHPEFPVRDMYDSFVSPPKSSGNS
tara:strand:- start:12037 stop:12321 length:285 start_codon:yes stop_codon:yes gene_type:complete